MSVVTRTHAPSVVRHRRRAVGFIGAMVVLLAGGTTAAWPSLRFDPGHTGDNPQETTLSASNVSQLVTKWTFQTGSTVDATPAVVNGIVYIGSLDHKFYALDAK